MHVRDCLSAELADVYTYVKSIRFVSFFDYPFCSVEYVEAGALVFYREIKIVRGMEFRDYQAVSFVNRVAVFNGKRQSGFGDQFPFSG